MHSYRTPKTRAFTVWLFAVLMLLGGLAPAISQALMAQRLAQGLPFAAELCSTSAAQADASRTAPTDDQALHAGAHCPACLIQAHAPGLPPAEMAPLPLQATASQAVPSLFLRAPRPLFAWSPLSARAPPSLA